MSVNPVFFKFNKTDNLLEKLIEHFINKGWKFEVAPSGYFHKYSWPDIVLSDKKGTLPKLDENNKTENENENFSIELLGAYRPKGNCESEEGEVVLFMPKIKETAERFRSEKKPPSVYDFEAEKKYTELLSTIILIHEFVHWIMHWIKCPNFILPKELSNGFIPFKYKEVDEVYFHEGFAQLLTKLICDESESELKEMFNWLVAKQPKQYTVYKDLKLIDIKGAISCLEFMRLYNLQSWEITKQWFDDFFSKIAYDHAKTDKSNSESIRLIVKDFFKGQIWGSNSELWNLALKEVIIKYYPDLEIEYHGSIKGKGYGI